MTLPDAQAIGRLPLSVVVWLGIFAGRVACYLAAGALLALRRSPFGWRF